MLKQLYIKDFTLIDELNIPFHSGFSVITGETGAGKSIILGALQLLLGQRADTKQIKLGRKKCIIEAHFDLSNYGMQDFFDANEIDYDPSDCILRREVSITGKAAPSSTTRPYRSPHSASSATASLTFTVSIRTSCCRKKTSN